MCIFLYSSCLSEFFGSGGSREAASSDEATDDGEERGGEVGRYEGGHEVPRVHPEEEEEDQCYDYQVYESIASRRRRRERESTFEGRRRTALCLGCAHDARDHRHRYLLFLLALSSSEGVRAADDLGTEHHQLQELLAGGKTSLRVHGQLRQRQRRAHLPSPRNSRTYTLFLPTSPLRRALHTL